MSSLTFDIRYLVFLYRKSFLVFVFVVNPGVLFEAMFICNHVIWKVPVTGAKMSPRVFPDETKVSTEWCKTNAFFNLVLLI